MRKAIVEFSYPLFSVFFIKSILDVEWSLASVQQGIEDDPETPYVDSLVILAFFDNLGTSKLRFATWDKHFKSKVSWST